LRAFLFFCQLRPDAPRCTSYRKYTVNGRAPLSVRCCSGSPKAYWLDADQRTAYSRTPSGNATLYRVGVGRYGSSLSSPAVAQRGGRG